MTVGAAPVVAIVSPGAMGSAIGATLERGGARVVATVDGRSERTRSLVGRTRIELLPDLETVVREASVVLSIVPPEAAQAVVGDLARTARNLGAHPLVADVNAISPGTARRLAETATSAGCELVDGSISGPPPWKAETTRLYLSGPRAADVASLPFEGVDRIVVGTRVGAASAVKMSTASVYKGTTALLLQALLAARANGVLEHVVADLRTAAPELLADVERLLAGAAAKSRRYVREMREIADTQDAAGLTPALFEAMAEVYERVANTELARTSPEDIRPDARLGDLLDRLF